MKKESRVLYSQGKQDEAEFDSSNAEGMVRGGEQGDKKIFANPMVKVLVGSVAFMGLLYASRFIMNHAAESIRAYKNLKKAVQEK
jgi:hypothetical protein